jgi:hypothetical protein
MRPNSLPNERRLKNIVPSVKRTQRKLERGLKIVPGWRPKEPNRSGSVKKRLKLVSCQPNLRKEVEAEKAKLQKVDRKKLKSAEKELEELEAEKFDLLTKYEALLEKANSIPASEI